MKYRLSVIGFGQISVICYPLNLTNMPSLKKPNLHVFSTFKFCYLQKLTEDCGISGRVNLFNMIKGIGE